MTRLLAYGGPRLWIGECGLSCFEQKMYPNSLSTRAIIARGFPISIDGGQIRMKALVLFCTQIE